MTMTKEELIAQSDKMMENDQWKQLYDILMDETKNAYMDDPDICWRMAWNCHEVANIEADNKKKRKELTFEGFKHVTRGYQIDPSHGYCNLWSGIFLDLTSEYDGIKKRLENSGKVKEFFERALEVNPKDALTLHSLGVWYFEFADIPWYEQKLASLISNPPKCTYDDALKYFLEAEESDPNFYSCNLLYLGKCYFRKNDKPTAKQYLTRCVEYKGNSSEDQEAKEEAKALLKKL